MYVNVHNDCVCVLMYIMSVSMLMCIMSVCMLMYIMSVCVNVDNECMF